MATVLMFVVVTDDHGFILFFLVTDGHGFALFVVVTGGHGLVLFVVVTIQVFFHRLLRLNIDNTMEPLVEHDMTKISRYVVIARTMDCFPLVHLVDRLTVQVFGHITFTCGFVKFQV